MLFFRLFNVVIKKERLRRDGYCGCQWNSVVCLFAARRNQPQTLAIRGKDARSDGAGELDGPRIRQVDDDRTVGAIEDAADRFATSKR